MQTYLNQRKVLLKKTTNIIQVPTVNQHQHWIFIIISKQILIIINILLLNTNTSNS